MLGMDAEPGIYLQTLSDLFQAIEEGREDVDCSVSMSYFEVSLPSWLRGQEPRLSGPVPIKCSCGWHACHCAPGWQARWKPRSQA